MFVCCISKVSLVGIVFRAESLFSRAGAVKFKYAENQLFARKTTTRLTSGIH